MVAGMLVHFLRKRYTNMEEKIVTILNEMAEYLNVSQMKKLQEVMLKAFAQNTPEKAEISNEDYLKMFLDAKKIKERRVYFDAKAKVHLKEYLDSRTDDNPALFVTLNAPHKRLKISGVEIRIRALGRSVSAERIHPHKFRRTMATRAIDKGMPIEQVQKILGHSQIDTTIQYAMVNQTNVKKFTYEDTGITQHIVNEV